MRLQGGEAQRAAIVFPWGYSIGSRHSESTVGSGCLLDSGRLRATGVLSSAA